MSNPGNELPGATALRDAERARLAVEVAQLGTWSWTPGNDGVELDARSREVCGLEGDGPLSLADVVARLHPDDRKRVEAALQRAAAAGGDGEYSEKMRFVHLDGSERSVVARGRAQGAGDADGVGRGALVPEVLGTLLDITEQVRAARRYQELFNAIDQGFCLIEMIFDAGGRAIDYRFLEVNPTFSRQTGLHDPVGRTARELVPGLEPRWFETYGRVATSGEPERFVDASDAMGRVFDVYAFRLDSAGRQVALLFSDVSERRRAEQASLEADCRKDEFLSTLSHELRNPLAPIRTSLHVLRMSDDPATVRRLHEIMGRQVDQLTRLVDELTEVSRITRGKIELRVEVLDVAAVVRAAVDASRAQLDGAGHVLSLALPDAALRIRGDAVRLGQVVTNLLANAIRYSEPGTRVSVRLCVEGDHALLAVADDGMGIAAENLGNIFEMFTRLERSRGRDRGGLGIGLALVRSLVAMHGGTIEARSEGTGRGSEFLVRLPLLEVDAGTETGDLARVPGDLTGLRVLVVDDNRDAADSFGDWLQQFGAEARVVHDGRTALAMLAEHMPDVVLLDIDMPDMDGYEVARRIRAMASAETVTLVAVTGWGQALDGSRAPDGSFDHHMSKPPDLPALHALLQSLKVPRRAEA